MIGMLIMAWALTCFNFDEIVINGADELFNKKITVNGYYLIFAIVGLLIDICH